MTESAAAAPTVERLDARHRYAIQVAGETAGFTAYRDRWDRRVFFHTEIDDAYAGQGLASILVREAWTTYAVRVCASCRSARTWRSS